MTNKISGLLTTFAVYAKAISEGKTAPFNHHAGNFQVDIATIPLGTQIGATALLEIFKK